MPFGTRPPRSRSSHWPALSRGSCSQVKRSCDRRARERSDSRTFLALGMTRTQLVAGGVLRALPLAAAAAVIAVAVGGRLFGGLAVRSGCPRRGRPRRRDRPVRRVAGRRHHRCGGRCGVRSRVAGTRSPASEQCTPVSPSKRSALLDQCGRHAALGRATANHADPHQPHDGARDRLRRCGPRSCPSGASSPAPSRGPTAPPRTGSVSERGDPFLDRNRIPDAIAAARATPDVHAIGAVIFDDAGRVGHVHVPIVANLDDLRCTPALAGHRRRTRPEGPQRSCPRPEDVARLDLGVGDRVSVRVTPDETPQDFDVVGEVLFYDGLQAAGRARGGPRGLVRCTSPPNCRHAHGARELTWSRLERHRTRRLLGRRAPAATWRAESHPRAARTRDHHGPRRSPRSRRCFMR